MTEEIPSATFAEQVMEKVREYHEAETGCQRCVQKLVSAMPVRIMIAGGATVVGVWNVFRIYYSLFAPALCK